jgi:arylformamidase
MEIVDLSLPLFDHMPVFDGDPEVIIQEIHKLGKEGWNLRNMTFTTHIGTHINVPYHMVENGKKLDDIPLNSFIGKAVLYKKGMVFNEKVGVIFSNTNIDQEIADQLVQSPPKFVGLSVDFEFDLDMEKYLLKYNIISYENLINTEKLPNSFMFYGLPLNIKGSDGSPVRAFAEVE